MSLSKKDKYILSAAIVIFVLLLSVVLFHRESIDQLIFGEVVEEVEWNKEDYERAFTLSPSSSEIHKDSFDIDILTHFDEAEAMMIEVLLSFSGETAKYQSFSQGDIEGCEVDSSYGEELERKGDLLLVCLIPPNQDPYKGSDVFTTLHFDVLEEGEFGVEFLDPDGDGDLLESGRGERYMLK